MLTKYWNTVSNQTRVRLTDRYDNTTRNVEANHEHTDNGVSYTLQKWQN